MADGCGPRGLWQPRRCAVAVLGPAPAYVARRAGRWRWNVVLRGDRPLELLRPAAGRRLVGRRGPRLAAVGASTGGAEAGGDGRAGIRGRPGGHHVVPLVFSDLASREHVVDASSLAAAPGADDQLGEPGQEQNRAGPRHCRNCGCGCHAGKGPAIQDQPPDRRLAPGKGARHLEAEDAQAQEQLTERAAGQSPERNGVDRRPDGEQQLEPQRREVGAAGRDDGPVHVGPAAVSGLCESKDGGNDERGGHQQGEVDEPGRQSTRQGGSSQASCLT